MRRRWCSALAACWLAAPGCARSQAATVAPEVPVATVAAVVESAPAPEELPAAPDEAALQAALARDVRDAGAYEGLARLYHKRGRTQPSYRLLARQVIAQGLAVLAREGRTSADLLATRGMMALEDGRSDRAIEDLAAAIAIDPSHAAAQRALGAAAFELRDFSRAREALLVSTRDREGAKDVEAWLRLGLAEQNLGQFAAAAQAFRSASEADPKDPRPHLLLGDLANHVARVEDDARAENEAQTHFHRAASLAAADARFAAIRAIVGERIAGRRYFACYYPVGSFYGTEEEHAAWRALRAAEYEAGRGREERDAAERRRLLELERRAEEAERRRLLGTEDVVREPERTAEPER